MVGAAAYVATVRGGVRYVRTHYQEFQQFALRERPPVPYVPEKDPVQETVSALKSDQSPKMTIGEDVELS
jgi:hypothetical protein